MPALQDIAYNDWLVAAIALAGSLVSIAICVGPWKQPYQLRSIARIVERYGMNAARCVWLLIALVSFIAGISIASGFRPSYAKPSSDAVDAPR